MDLDGNWRINYVDIKKSERRKGHAENLYKDLNNALQKNNQGALYSDKTLLESEDDSGVNPPQLLWEKLAGQGLAEKLEDGTYRFKPTEDIQEDGVATELEPKVINVETRPIEIIPAASQPVTEGSVDGGTELSTGATPAPVENVVGESTEMGVRKGVDVGTDMEGNRFPSVDEVYDIIESEMGRQGTSFIKEDEDSDGEFDSEEQARAYAADVEDRLAYLHSQGEIPIYRAVAADEVDLDPYGIGDSWSYSLESAKNFARQNIHGDNVKIIRGYVPAENVDWEGAVRTHLMFNDDFGGSSEDELPVRGGAKILDVDVVDLKGATELPSKRASNESSKASTLPPNAPPPSTPLPNVPEATVEPLAPEPSGEPVVAEGITQAQSPQQGGAEDNTGVDEGVSVNVVPKLPTNRGGSNALVADVTIAENGDVSIKSDEGIVYDLPKGDFENLRINGKKATPNQKKQYVNGGISLRHAIESTIQEHKSDNDPVLQNIKNKQFNQKYHDVLDRIKADKTIFFEAAGKDGNVWVESTVEVSPNGDVVITPIKKGIVDKENYKWSPDVLISERNRFATKEELSEDENENEEAVSSPTTPLTKDEVKVEQPIVAETAASESIKPNPFIAKVRKGFTSLMKAIGAKNKVEFIGDEEAAELIGKDDGSLKFQILDEINVFDSPDLSAATNFINKAFAATENQAEEKTVYRKLAVKYHPDRNKSATATEIMKHLNNVKDRYDKGLKSAPPPPTSSQSRPQPPPQPEPTYSKSDWFKDQFAQDQFKKRQQEADKQSEEAFYRNPKNEPKQGFFDKVFKKPPTKEQKKWQAYQEYFAKVDKIEADFRKEMSDALNNFEQMRRSQKDAERRIAHDYYLKKTQSAEYSKRSRLETAAIQFKYHLQGMSFMRNSQGTILGFVQPQPDGSFKVWIDPKTTDAETPIHELGGHIFLPLLKESNPEFYQKGVDLIQNTPYLANAKKLGLEGDAAVEEALAQAIGEKGKQLSESQRPGFLEWLKGMWDKVGKALKLNVPIQNLTLGEFTDIIAGSVLEGESIFTALEAKGEEGRTMRKQFDKATLKKAEYITKNFENIVRGMESDGKLRIDCP